MKSLCTADLSRMTIITRRLAWRSPRLAKVTIRSANGRRRLALVSVVWMRPWVNRAVARFASIKRSWAAPPPRRGPLVGLGIVVFSSVCHAKRWETTDLVLFF